MATPVRRRSRLRCCAPRWGRADLLPLSIHDDAVRSGHHNAQCSVRIRANRRANHRSHQNKAVHVLFVPRRSSPAIGSPASRIRRLRQPARAPVFNPLLQTIRQPRHRVLRMPDLKEVDDLFGPTSRFRSLRLLPCPSVDLPGTCRRSSYWSNARHDVVQHRIPRTRASSGTCVRCLCCATRTVASTTWAPLYQTSPSCGT